MYCVLCCFGGWWLVFGIFGGAASKFTFIISCSFDLNFSSSLIINEIISSKFLSVMYDI